jgi:hypothetical protein
MGMPSKAARFVLALGVALCGCSVLTTFDGFVGPPLGGDAAAGDATSQGDGAVGSDGATSVDDGSNGDAGATDGAGDAGPALCASVDAALCEDFDSPDGGYRNAYDLVSVSNGGALAIDTSTSTSGGASLSVTVPAQDAGSPATAGLWKAVPHTGHVRYSFDLMIRSGAASGVGVLFALIEIDNQNDAGGYAEYRLKLNDTAHYEVHIFPQNVVDMAPLPTDILASGKWNHVVLDLVMPPPPAAASATVTVGAGAPVSCAFPDSMGGPGDPSIVIGVYHSLFPTTAWSFNVDSVVVETF